MIRIDLLILETSPARGGGMDDSNAYKCRHDIVTLFNKCTRRNSWLHDFLDPNRYDIM